MSVEYAVMCDGCGREIDDAWQADQFAARLERPQRHITMRLSGERGRSWLGRTLVDSLRVDFHSPACLLQWAETEYDDPESVADASGSIAGGGP